MSHIIIPTAHHCVLLIENGVTDIFEVRRTRFGIQARFVEPGYEGPWGFGLTVKQAIDRSTWVFQEQLPDEDLCDECGLPVGEVTCPCGVTLCW